MSLFLSCLALAISAQVKEPDASQPLPEIWTVIADEAKAAGDVAQKEALQSDASNPFGMEFVSAFHRELRSRAKKLAAGYDRSAIETLYRSASHKGIGHDMQTLAKHTALHIADPDDKYGFHSIGSSTGGEALYVYLGAIDLYHDERSQKFLLDVALPGGKLPEERKSSTRGGAGAEPLALHLLRGYELEDLRKVLEAAILAEQDKNPRAKAAFPDSFFHEDDLKAVLSSMDYAARLKDPAERVRYLDFQSRFWRARAMGPRGFRGRNTEFQRVAEIIDNRWRDGDEKFVLHIFEDPASTPEELAVATAALTVSTHLPDRLLHARLPELKAKLAETAKKNNPQAAIARRALKELERRAGGF